MSKYERRFHGKDNAGLRARIRSVTSPMQCGEANAAAVMRLGRTVALSSFGRQTLAECAADFAVPGRKRTCDCHECYVANLQLLGANG